MLDRKVDGYHYGHQSGHRTLLGVEDPRCANTSGQDLTETRTGTLNETSHLISVYTRIVSELLGTCTRTESPTRENLETLVTPYLFGFGRYTPTLHFLLPS